MADDTNGHATGGTGPVDHRPDDRIVENIAPATPRSGATEWTASDNRGPLDEAPPIPPMMAHEDVPQESMPAAPILPAAAEETPDPHPTAATASVAEAPRRSLIPVAAALIVGAVIGAGSAFLVYQSQPGAGADLDQKMAQLSGRVDAIEKRPDPQPAIAALKTSVAALESKAAPSSAGPTTGPSSTKATSRTTPSAAVTPPDGAVPVSSASTTRAEQNASNAPPTPTTQAASTAPASGQTQSPTSSADTAALQQKVAALQATLDTLQKQASDAKALEGKVGDLQTTVDGLKAQGTQVKTLQTDLAGVTTAVAGVQKQASGAQAGVEAIQGQQKSFEGRISAPALAVVADSLVQQIDQGLPYNQQVDALATLGADPAHVAILRENARKGVPSAKALSGQFAPLAEPILATEHKVAANAGLLDRLKSGMSSLVSIRSTTETAGDGLDARVSRIEADLTHDDVTGAYATWNALPADAKAKSETWGALAKTSAEAIDAARALQQGAIASLGARKS